MENLLGVWHVHDIKQTGDRSIYMGSYTLTLTSDFKYKETAMGYPLSIGDWEFNEKDSIIKLSPNMDELLKSTHPLLNSLKFVLGYDKLWNITIEGNMMFAKRLNSSQCNEYNTVSEMIMRRL